jgi:predicted dehydrogenase
MRPTNRREFFLDTARISAALTAAGLIGPRSVAEPRDDTATKADPIDRMRVAVIGTGGRGGDHVNGFLDKQLNCEIVAVCDCDERAPLQKLRTINQVQGKAPHAEKDLRRILDDKSIDAVSIATPNHWHSLAAIWAIQAGKHVYVEKPVSHNVSEGRRVVEAARKYNKICQTGTQCRSFPGSRDAIQFIHDGKIGKVHTAFGLCYKPRGSIGKVQGVGLIPWSLDYDLWCGPAPKRDPHRLKLHYDWHWQWDYGNGDLGNQGIHQMDVARWGLNKHEMPKSVFSLGGRFGYEDDGETANTQMAVFDYGDCQLIFEVRGLRTADYLADRRGKPTNDRAREAKVGNVFLGEKGYVVCTGYNSSVALDNDDKVLQVFGQPRGGEGHAHYANFTQAVRAGRRELLNADIEEGHLSSAMCHLANISYRLGREIPFDSQETKVVSGHGGEDKLATETLQHMRKHLEDNKVDLAKVQCRVGQKLTLDPANERFVDSLDANKMLTREYRKGFEVPARI